MNNNKTKNYGQFYYIYGIYIYINGKTLIEINKNEINIDETANPIRLPAPQQRYQIKKPYFKKFIKGIVKNYYQIERTPFYKSYKIDNLIFDALITEIKTNWIDK